MKNSEEIFKLVIGNFFLWFLILGLVAGAVSLLFKPKPLTRRTVVEVLFSYFLLIAIGLNNLVNFVFHVFYGDLAASFIGWAQSPFQAEVGFASLGIGITGVIAFRASLPFQAAALIPPVVFSLGAAGGHIYQMIVEKNFAPGNVGLVLPTDIVLPLVGFLLLWLCYRYSRANTI